MRSGKTWKESTNRTPTQLQTFYCLRNFILIRPLKTCWNKARVAQCKTETACTVQLFFKSSVTRFDIAFLRLNNICLICRWLNGLFWISATGIFGGINKYKWLVANFIFSCSKAILHTKIELAQMLNHCLTPYNLY